MQIAGKRSTADSMPDRIYLANVGANASHRFSSPLFEDGSFEFIPIPEDRALPDPHAVRYRDLRSFNKPEGDLKSYVPERLWDTPAHNDPEFKTLTYGDNCETSPRAASLRQMERGDLLLFIARLASFSKPYKAPSTRPTHPTTYGFYLVGFLEIEEVLRDVQCRPRARDLRRFSENAHVRRGMSDDRLWDRFWVFGGSDRSRRFRRAVPVTRAMADRVFTSADGSPWQWPLNRTELQVIGSYTRSCRCVVDPGLPGHATRAEALWEWVREHEGPAAPIAPTRAAR